MSFRSLAGWGAMIELDRLHDRSVLADRLGGRENGGMSDPFVVDGEVVEDSVLYFWTLQSMSRALRFSVEARQQLSSASSYPNSSVLIAFIFSFK